MLLNIYNYLCGYVVIKVSGFSVERFINLVIHKNIHIWDLKHSGTYVIMKVSLKGFKKLKPYAKKTKCRIRIIEKCGYPFFIYKYRKRYLFIFGILSFIIAMYVLSSFIWLIEISGNDRIDSDTILSFCEDNGFKTGSFKYNIDTKELEKKIKNNFPDLSWISISIKGTKASIKVTETLPKLEIIDYSQPCDIIAKCDGLITSIYVNKGTPLVKAKDVVEKGTVLVSGKLTLKEGENPVGEEFVHSQANIKAKIFHEIKFSVPFEYTTKKYTQNIKNTYEIIIFGKKIDLNIKKNYISFNNYDRIISRKQLSAGRDFVLPIIIIKNTYKEYEFENKKRSYDEAKKIAEKNITKKIIQQIDTKTDIIDKNIEYNKTEEQLNVKAIISVIEDIGQEQAISDTATIEGSQNIDGTTKNTDTE